MLLAEMSRGAQRSRPRSDFLGTCFPQVLGARVAPTECPGEEPRFRLDQLDVGDPALVAHALFPPFDAAEPQTPRRRGRQDRFRRFSQMQLELEIRGAGDA